MNIDDLITGGSSAPKRRAKSKQSGASSTTAARKRPRNETKTTEDDLLALALGSSSSGIRDAEQYEESVIRDAELSSTPRLMTNETFGFPSLEGLVPSRSVRADLGNARNVLGGLRKGAQNSVRLLTNAKDCLKEQMLLALMQSASGDFEMGVFPQQEAKQEWKRRKLHRSKIHNNVIDPHTNNAVEKSKRQQQSNDSHRDNGLVVVVDDETPEGRLEGIKKGTQKKSVRFSSDVKNPTKLKSLLSKKVLKLKPQRRRRVTIQERRRQEGSVGHEEIEGDDENEGEITRDEIVKHLKQLRIEREKRRKKRKQAWGKKNDSESEEEFEFTGNESQPTTVDAIVPDIARSSTHLSAVCPPVEQTANTTTTIVCPLCGEEIPVPERMRVKTEEGGDPIDEHDKSHRDAILAQHMSLCQTQRRSGRRKREDNPSSLAAPRGLPIQRKRRVSRPNYAEIDEEQELAAAGSSSQIDNETIGDNDADDDYIAIGGMEEEEEEELLNHDTNMDEDDKEIATGKSTRSKPKSRRSSRTKSAKKTSRASSNYSRLPPLDDWYEEDYEDRVDEWIDHGLEKMPVMSERDENEIPPGEEEYDGGLIVPAWINDRLFPYQRTGLQWMWELHRQQSGGILGDEMVCGMEFSMMGFHFSFCFREIL